jgi:hypothetical protein
VRQLIIDYLVRCQGDTDYATREGIARCVAGEFWSGIESSQWGGVRSAEGSP